MSQHGPLIQHGLLVEPVAFGAVVDAFVGGAAVYGRARAELAVLLAVEHAHDAAADAAADADADADSPHVADPHAADLEAPDLEAPDLETVDPVALERAVLAARLARLTSSGGEHPR